MSKYESLKKLYVSFGKSINDAQIERWIEELNNVNDLAIKHAVEYLVRHSDSFPSLARLIETARMMQPLKFDDYKEDCQFCGGVGRVTIKKTFMQSEDSKVKLDFCYRCICRNSDKYTLFPEVKEWWLYNKIAPGIYDSEEEIEFTQGG